MSINKFKINVNDMPTGIITRAFDVYGDIGDEFEIIALQADTLKFYNFKTKAFALGHSSINNNLKVKLKSRRYHDSIIFPSTAGDYVIKIIASKGTSIQGVDGGTMSRTITKQGSNATITFKVDQPTNGYATVPTTTSTGVAGAAANVHFDWDITGASSDAYGFGFRLTGDFEAIDDGYWYTKVTTDVDGAISSSRYLTIDSLTDIGVGTTISSGSGLSGTPIITAINTSTKTLTLSTPQSLSDGVTLTFLAKGASNIKEATGLDLTFVLFPVVTPTVLTKTVRTDTDGATTITLNNTLGISGGNHVTYTGFGVNNSSSNVITEVVPDPSGGDGDGSIVVQLSQSNIPQGTVLTFAGSHHVINFKGDIIINSFTTASKTVYLDIPRIITIGTDS